MAVGRDVDPDRVHRAREAMRRRLAHHMAETLAFLHETIKPPRPLLAGRRERGAARAAQRGSVFADGTGRR